MALGFQDAFGQNLGWLNDKANRKVRLIDHEKSIRQHFFLPILHLKWLFSRGSLGIEDNTPSNLRQIDFPNRTISISLDVAFDLNWYFERTEPNLHAIDSGNPSPSAHCLLQVKISSTLFHPFRRPSFSYLKLLQGSTAVESTKWVDRKRKSSWNNALSTADCSLYKC